VTGLATVITFDNVDLWLEVSSRTVGGTVLVVVGLVLDVDLCVDVTLVRFAVAGAVSGTGLSKEGKQRCGKRESGRREEDMGGWGKLGRAAWTPKLTWQHASGWRAGSCCCFSAWTARAARACRSEVLRAGKAVGGLMLILLAWKQGKRDTDLPVLFDTDLGLSVGTRRTLFFVDVNVLLSAFRLTVAVLFCDSDLLFKAAGRRGLGWGVAVFVTFPSAVRAGKVDLLFYFDLCRVGDSITPIRGRED
jgi:hypothetical protein